MRYSSILQSEPLNIVLCCAVDKLSHESMLGMEWPTSVNPTILWFNYEVDLVHDNCVVGLN